MGNSLDLDEVDRAILRNLRENACMSLQEISRRSGISDATIQFRLKRMKANGAIERFTIMANPAATGYAKTAGIHANACQQQEADGRLCQRQAL
jgi:Lrp/AsnC family transcriptional regulator for asnA, asnC and gidA